MQEKNSGIGEKERIVEIEVERLREFRGHPFKVKPDDQMNMLMESIKKYGILNPLIVRPIPDGAYEIISGNRRRYAAQKLGYRKVPVIIRVLKDEEAVISMVDSNMHREVISPSEKAFACKMKYDAIKRKNGFSSNGQDDYQYKGRKSIEIMGEEMGESPKQVQRFIRLTELIPELLEYVDQKRLQFTVAVEISYIDKEVQKWLYEYIKDNGMVRLNQVVLLRAQMKTGAITQAKMISMLNNSQPGKGPATKLTFSEKKLREFFPAHYTSTQMRDVIEDLLSDWKHKQDFEGLNGE